MWQRSELKSRAKDVLRGIYWKALLISIVIAIAGGNTRGGTNFSWRGNNSSKGSNITNGVGHAMNQFSPSISAIIFFVIGIVAAIVMISTIFRVFVGYHLEVGGRKYFVYSAQYLDNKGCFSFAFRSQNYFSILLTMLLRFVQNFLWYLLFIIPGIVKSYAYRMVPYILADNPNIGYKRAIQLSNQMTNGHKFDMFILDLSFLGWYILGALALVVGMVFVFPYENATNAELYLVLRKNAIEYNYCTYDELLLCGPEELA